MAYPLIPTFEPRTETEDVIATGQRALTYLLDTPNPYLLDTDALECAQYVATIAVRSGDMLDTAREQIQNVRSAILRTLTARRLQAIDNELLQALKPKAATETKPQGGSKVRAPKPTPAPPAPSAIQFPETVDAF